VLGVICQVARPTMLSFSVSGIVSIWLAKS